MNNDLYDVSKYTDEQLYNILDMDNPSDRELEAKIVHLINKYSNMQNEAGYKLAVFFQNIYSHFFDLNEGFDNPLQISNDYIDQSGNSQKDISNAINENTNLKSTTATSFDIQTTTSFNYIKDKFGINPLLKQTIKRIICIDSQYRDNKNTTLSTDFTFNLSEPLRDVVSLKLESIQIPITWYTISKSYGSNFFYLKGNTDGINNGYHDYQFAIQPKNYTLSKTDINTANIYDAVNKSITDASNMYTDVNFGITSIQSINGSSKSQFILDIQKSYDYSYFYLSFPNWAPSVYSADITGINLINKRSQYISSYLGFNQNIYNSNTIYSNQTKLNTSTYNQTIRNKYPLDIYNNYFDIIRYNGINYNVSSIIDSYRIHLSLPVNNSYSIIDLYNDINNQINNSSFLDISYSNFNKIDINDLQKFNYGKTYFSLSIKLNRYKIKPIPNTNLLISFPDFYNSIWYNCFNFDNSLNQLNIIYSETPLIKSDYYLNKSVNILFKCISPPEYINIIDISINYYDNSGNPYLLNDLLSELNSKFLLNPYTKDSIIKLNNDNITEFNINIEKDFINKDFYFFIKDISSALNIIGIYDINNIDTSYNDNNTIIYGNFLNKLSGYTIDSSYIISYNQIINPNNIIINDVYLSEKYKRNDNAYSFTTYVDLLNEIKFCINNNILYKNTSYSQYPLYNTSILSYCNDPFTNNSNVDISLNIIIQLKITETNYKMILNEGDNPYKLWTQLKLDLSYNLIDNKITYSEIIGNEPISSNKININDLINIFPYYDFLGGAYSISNNKSISINSNKTYSVYSLLLFINNYFNTNQILYGSKIETIYDKNNNEYIKITLNINVIYTTKDYKIVFYDPYSFVKCFIGARSVQNTTWDSTLGWILGFRDYTEYILEKSNQMTDGSNYYYLDSTQGLYQYNEYFININTYTDNSKNIVNNNIISNNIIFLTGDTSCTLNIYNYFYIILDDYIQNHINDGLVSLTQSQTSIALPSYASQANKNCDPVTNTQVLTTIQNTNGLTSKQIYALNQSLISNNNKEKKYSNMSYIADIFAMIPLKISGLPNGSYYVETGGNLQNQERSYFGPVNIQRMTVKLVNDKGDSVDLNKVDWSFSFICEQLYRT